MSYTGSLLFAKYAFAPNKLRYCGPDDNRDFFDYCVAQESDKGLIELLKGFEGAYPYLQLIARANKIKDPFDEKVVEAYWIGNSLLTNVKTNDFYEQLKNRFSGKIDQKMMKWLLPKPAEGAKPHHSFHVLDVYTKTGLIRMGVKSPILKTINNCLIMWGKVIRCHPVFDSEVAQTRGEQQRSLLAGKAEISSNRDSSGLPQNDKLINQPFEYTQGKPFNQLTIQYYPINLEEGKLVYGKLATREVISLFISPKVGDYVSIHWGNVCDVLDRRQLKNLQVWTKYHMEIANKTI